MIYCYTPFDDGFPYTEAEEMYEKNKESIGDDNTFEGLLKDTLFFAFKEDEKLIGCIYYYTLEDNLWYVNAFAGRKTHLTNLKCLKWSLNGFQSDIYAKTHHKTAKLCLNKLGFEKINENLYRYSRR